ncbi:hypothetical protein DSM112329_05045 [Paraconexibacter sp. AEG42_29]|uniref:Alkaline phosphatase family protein n=1 Tax=Paraconexibacter sp. AEG42_29 TaxID=2997339 RepID=A0AAU7B3M1_9ACTN
MESFAEIPSEVERRVRAGERVVLILLDALGLAFLERHDDHPLVRRLAVTPLRSQFPSTTTAHVTTMHFGLPVEDHGLYEWNVLEPTLDTVICPFMFTPSGAPLPGGLLGKLDPAALAPGPSFYRRLGVPCAMFGPRRIDGSPFGTVALDGAARHPFDELADGALALAAAMRDPDGPVYAHLYWDLIDAVGHRDGPSSPAFDAEARAALDALWTALESLEGVTVLFTADHGQVDVAPDRVDYLDELWPELPGHLSHAHPAGSSRDCFLHVLPDHVDAVLAGLGDRLDGLAEVRPAASLFPRVGPLLAARLADVVVLPVAGRQAWLRSAAGPEQVFRGHHGGLDPAETGTYLARLT